MDDLWLTWTAAQSGSSEWGREGVGEEITKWRKRREKRAGRERTKETRQWVSENDKNESQRMSVGGRHAVEGGHQPKDPIGFQVALY